jgi:hypothetical protein
VFLSVQDLAQPFHSSSSFYKKKLPKMWFNDREGERGIENHGNSAGIMSTANSTDAIHAWRSRFG